MRKSGKPVRKCGRCPLNQGDHCWGFLYPREQWNHRKCPAFENELACRLFRDWEQEIPVRTRKKIRREMFVRRKAPASVAHLERNVEGIRRKQGAADVK
jgi:hypothetical protein